MNRSFTSDQPQLARIQLIALIVGVVGLILSVVGAFLSLEQFFQSYLLGFLFWLGVALGSLALLMLQHVAGGLWGPIARRPLEAGALTLPLMVLFFLPILLGASELYIWARPQQTIIAEAGPEIAKIIQNKSRYLNLPLFAIRALGYFVLWTLLAFLFNRWSVEQDRTADPRIISRFKGLGGVGLVLYVLSMTLAVVDWSMSIDPQFYSTIYGLIYGVGQVLETFCFLVIFLLIMSKRPPYANVVVPNRIHDLGKFILGFVILWTYVNLAQFIIIWSGNLPEEATWYVARGQGGWNILSILLVLFHFFVPLFILLSRKVKRNVSGLAVVSAGILIVRLIDNFWLLAPSFHPEGFSFSWLDIVVPIGIGGIWIAAFIWLLGRKPLLPLHDPRLESHDPNVEQAAPPLTGGVASGSSGGTSGH